MIPRYSRAKMSSLWSRESVFSIWRDIECHIAIVMAQEGIIPKEAANEISAKASFNIERIDELEKELKHDVLAFLTNMSENIGASSRYLHYGITSSDLIDTAFAVQLVKASDILLAGLDKLLKTLEKKAKTYKYTACMGRSHGVHAEITSFGLKIAGFYAEFKRNKKRLEQAKKEIAVMSISGAVGTYAHIPPKIEIEVAKRIGLEVDTHSTQIIARDRHACFFTTLAIIAGAIERLSIEIRHLQRTEVLEIEEFFDEKQKGSSSMPHKRNPILSENLTGIARIIRSYAMPALENIALWHERDISHSSVERIIAPDATITLDFAINRMNKIIDNLIVYPENMRKNINLLRGLTQSQKAMLTLIQKGCERDEAYRLIQKNSMKTWKDKKSNLKQLMLNDENITQKINEKEIEEIFENKTYLKEVDYIFNRIFNQN